MDGFFYYFFCIKISLKFAYCKDWRYITGYTNVTFYQELEPYERRRSKKAY